MKIGTGIGGWPRAAAASARRAEDLGYDFISTGELGHDSLLIMAMAASATSTVELQTSVTIAFPRSPFVSAMAAWDLQDLSRGRFIIGLGTQVKGHNERRYGMKWEPGPATRMKEYILMMRAVWNTFQTGARPAFQGKYYQFTLVNPNSNAGPIDYPRPKVFLACVGDAMARVAGEVADGVVPHTFTTDAYMRQVVLKNIKVGLERAGRDWSSIEIGGGGMTVFGETESDIEQGLERLRQPISYYGSTRSYHEVFDVHGWRDLGERLHALSRDQKWDEMLRAIPEEVLRAFAQTSTYDKLPQFVAQNREYATRFSFSMAANTEEAQERLRHVVAELRKVKTPGVPRGLEIEGSPGRQARSL